MKGVNFSCDDFDEMIQLIQKIYSEADTWDYKIEITKEKETYNIWICELEE